MITVTVSPLRQRMIEDMNARKVGAGTQGHIRSCKQFAAFLKRSPETATAEDIRRFQLHLSETGIRICNRNRIMTGVRFLFRVTLRRLDLAAEIYHLREPQKIAQVMSPSTGLRHRPRQSGSTPHDAVASDPPLLQQSPAFLLALSRPRPGSHRCAAFNSRRATNPAAQLPDRSFTPTQATMLRGMPIAATVSIQPQQA
jgi:hypothetical protein